MWILITKSYMSLNKTDIPCEVKREINMSTFLGYCLQLL